MGDDQGPPPPVDLEGFRAVMREAGVEEVVSTTVEIYLSEAPAIFRQIDEAVSHADSEEVRRAAHSLKSASGNIRAGRLADLLQVMEVLGKEGDLEAVRSAYPELRGEYEAVMEYLRTQR
jgi:HPt (histidine-containing phosphotransfer) domain-containing protein